MKKPNHDIVTVFLYNLWSKRAECSCGWQGQYRILRSRAAFDALVHSAAIGCHVDQPLICSTDPANPSWRRRILYATNPKKVM